MMHQMQEAIDSNKWMKPGDPIPSDVPLFIVNNSDSNKKIKLQNGFSIMLTAPGTQGAVQSIDPSVLRNPAIMALWANGAIRITSDATLSAKVMTSIAKRDLARAAEIKELRDSVVEDIDGGGNENETDVSYKAKSIVEPTPAGISTSADAVSLTDGDADGALL